jgi:hypothetical protein
LAASSGTEAAGRPAAISIASGSADLTSPQNSNTCKIACSIILAI